MRTLITLITLFFVQLSAAKVSVMFHPYDPTLPAIAEDILEAKQSVDMALYNIDTTAENPIIAAILSDDVQARMKAGTLKVRMIFEGYESKKKNQARMDVLESYGIDVRFMGSSRKMHHKFAVIDSGLSEAKLITGSANWSLGSFRNYNENILFFEDEPGIIDEFTREYNLLWTTSREFGEVIFPNHVTSDTEAPLDLGIESHFNTDNLKVSKGRLVKDSKAEGWTLTRQIVEAIDNAESHLEIATTRIRLRPIFDAIQRAAARGVKTEILLTMGEYEYRSTRKKMELKECSDLYEKSCSTSQNFGVYLNRKDFPGHENVQVRIKWFNIHKSAFLAKQMHSKYMIVDDNVVFTGSFNWSYSAEYQHIENLVELDREFHPTVVDNFQKDFQFMWNQNRGQFKPFIESLEQAITDDKEKDCSFEPMALSETEIDYLIGTGWRMGKSLKKVCK